MAPTFVAAVRQIDRRFVLATAVLPIALTSLAGPVLSAASRLSGHAVNDGAVDVNGLGFAVVCAGSLVTATLVLLSFTHRFPIERPRYAHLPLMSACATVVTALLVGSLPAASPAFTSTVTASAGLAVGVLIGRVAARSLLNGDNLSISTSAAPPSAVRYPLSRGATAVWTGRLPSVRSTSWLLTLPAIAFAWWLVRFGIPSMFLLFVLPATFVAHAMARANRRLWVTIGPSGVQLRSGLFKHLRLAVDLEYINAAAITEIERPRTFTSGWYSTAGQLRVTTRTGPALRLSLADETELVISMVDPSEAAGVLNTLLDQRSTPGAIHAIWDAPSC